MSKPKRYHLEMQKADDGDWVLYEDYARLKAEVDALMTNPTSRLLRAKQAENAVLAIENDSLKAEVERLRKAGDAVALDYAERIEIEAGETAKTLMKTVPVLREWNAAKEGKPSV
jgi:hypothetical protein